MAFTLPPFPQYDFYNGTGTPHYEIPKHRMPTLIKVHGVIVSFAWMVLASTGMLISRYFKRQWSRRSFLGRPLWLVLHITMVLVAVFLTYFGIALVYVYEGPYRSISEVDEVFLSVHPPCGAALSVFAAINPVVGLVRPPPKSSWRQIWLITHVMLGFVLFFLACFNVTTAFRHPAGVYPAAQSMMTGSLYFTWIFLSIVVVILELQRYWLSSKKDRAEETHPLHRKDGRYKILALIEEERGATFQRSVLWLYVTLDSMAFLAWSMLLFYHGP